MELRDYQITAIEEACAAIEAGVNACVVSPTGSGKTVIIGEVIDWCAEQGLSVLFVNDRLTVIKDVTGRLDTSKFDVMTLQSAYSKMNKGELKQYDVIIHDEAHKGEAKTYKQVLLNAGKIRLGFTGTPFRGIVRSVTDKYQTKTLDYRMCLTTIDDLYDKFITTIDTAELIKRGMLADYEIIKGEPIVIEASNAYSDYTNEDINEAVSEDALAGYISNIPDEKVIVFVHSVDYGKFLEKNVQGALFLDAQSTPEERNEKIDQFKEGEAKYLINVDLFSEGFDAPECNAVVLARPTLSVSKLFQQIGRGLRVKSDGSKLKLYDFVNNCQFLKVEPKTVPLETMINLGKFDEYICNGIGKLYNKQGEWLGETDGTSYVGGNKDYIMHDVKVSAGHGGDYLDKACTDIKSAAYDNVRLFVRDVIMKTQREEFFNREDKLELDNTEMFEEQDVHLQFTEDDYHRAYYRVHLMDPFEYDITCSLFGTTTYTAQHMDIYAPVKRTLKQRTDVFASLVNEAMYQSKNLGISYSDAIIQQIVEQFHPEFEDWNELVNIVLDNSRITSRQKLQDSYRRIVLNKEQPEQTNANPFSQQTLF
jgi:hypothetical protein